MLAEKEVEDEAGLEVVVGIGEGVSVAEGSVQG